MANFYLAVVSTFLLALASAVTVAGCGINIRNTCSYAVTACAQSGLDPINQYALKAGGSQYLDFGSACRWTAGSVWASVKGQCRVTGTTNGANDRNLANIAQFSIGESSTDFYDLSNVNAYTIPMLINPTSIAGGGTRSGMKCGSPGCTISNIPSFCKGNNQLVSHPTGAYSCINTDGTAGKSATSNTNLFKQACPSVYSYSTDHATSLYTCPTGSNYEIVFCPTYTAEY
eukprot:TRINITY_DN17405_c0_g1_i1.p1 TRINITY_DN17405_c0_g1~~TRINITY_DN17405_c0_g1_i1.p1  ORF type:complete len:230 (+),score=15.64 TRINITY_DN17405_c0_g1_i1:57-746(+)